MSALDVVIPAHHKDFDTLEACVRSVVRHVGGLRSVWVVSDRRFESSLAAIEWVPEPPGEVLPSIGRIREQWARHDPAMAGRAGWVYQQLLKLGAAHYIDGLSERYLAIDSDLVFLRGVSFDGARFPYSRSTEYHPPYLDAYRRLLGESPRGDESYTAHHMVYDRGLLTEMFTQIEKLHGVPWAQAYVDAVDVSQASSINEQDTYAHWVRSHHPEAAEHRQLKWRDSNFVPGLFARAALSLDYDFVAAHAYRRETKFARAKHVAARIRDELIRRG